MAMSAQLAIDQRTSYRGLRPLDPRKDLNQVADLIEEAFTGELEPGGIAALRDLRMLSHMGPLVGLMARSDPYLEDVLGGFVWIEDDRVVGNVTIPAARRLWHALADRQRGCDQGLSRAAASDGRWSWPRWSASPTGAAVGPCLQVRSTTRWPKGLYRTVGLRGPDRRRADAARPAPSQVTPAGAACRAAPLSPRRVAGPLHPGVRLPQRVSPSGGGLCVPTTSCNWRRAEWARRSGRRWDATGCAAG